MALKIFARILGCIWLGLAWLIAVTALVHYRHPILALFLFGFGMAVLLTSAELDLARYRRGIRRD